MFGYNVSNPAQNRAAWPAIIDLSEMRNARTFLKSTLATHLVYGTVPGNGRKSEGGLMEPVLRRFRNRVRRRLASVADTFREMLAASKPRSQDFGSQRMCPFCGLITPRSQRLCLECGKFN